MASGDWQAMSAPAPIRAPWAVWLRIFWWVLRKAVPLTDKGGPVGSLARLLARPTTVGGLKRLAMIGFARWSIIERAPSLGTTDPWFLRRVFPQVFGAGPGVEGTRPGAPKRRRSKKLPDPYLLFDSNYNGRSEEYLEAFSLIVPGGMNFTWGRGAYDVPSARRVSAFKRRVDEADVVPAYKYSGYDASTKQVLSALELRKHLERFSARAPASPGPEFRRDWNDLLTRVQTIRRVWPPAPKQRWKVISSLAPVSEGDQDELEARLTRHLQGDGLLPSDCTHFARWVLFKEFPSRTPGQPLTNRAFLMFSVWFDGSESAYFRELYQHLGPQRVLGIWELCGLPGPNPEVEDFKAIIDKHRVGRRGLKGRDVFTDFAGYPGATVRQIRCAVDLATRFRDLMAASQTLDDVTLHQRWGEFEGQRLAPASQVFAA